MTSTITPPTDTETTENAKPIDHQTDRPTGHSRTIGAAIAATVLAATGLLAYRTIEDSPQPTAPADTSQVPATNVDPNLNPHLNSDAAEYAQMERLADNDSSDAAESARMQRLAEESIEHPSPASHSQFLP